MAQKQSSEMMADLWSAYQMMAYKRLLDPHTDQHAECKRAFYAGGFQLVQMMVLLVTDEPGTDPNDTTLIDQVMSEINAFFQTEASIAVAMKH